MHVCGVRVHLHVRNSTTSASQNIRANDAPLCPKIEHAKKDVFYLCALYYFSFNGILRQQSKGGVRLSRFYLHGGIWCVRVRMLSWL